MSLDAMKQALDALEEINKLSIGENAIALPAEIDTAMDALRERLAQPELVCVCGAIWEGQELVSSPPQRKPLTEKRIEELYSFWVVDCQDIVGFARAIERTVKGEV